LATPGGLSAPGVFICAGAAAQWRRSSGQAARR